MRHVVGVAIALCAVSMLVPAIGPTQGRYAAELARALGLGANLTEDRAIGLLTASRLAPPNGWQKDKPADEAFIMELQKQMHVMLTEITQSLGVTTPPTLNVMMFARGQTGRQTFGVHARDLELLQPPKRGAGEDSKLKVGATAKVAIESPHPYPAGDERIPAVWTYRLRRPGATFVKVHFARLELAAPDYVVVLDKHGRELWRSVGGGKATANVWAAAVDGDTAVIALHADASRSAYGLLIDRYGYGTTAAK